MASKHKITIYTVLPKRLRSNKHARARFRSQSCRCFYCGGTLDETTNKEHVIPKSLGGSPGWKNILLTHKRCNSLRGNAPLTEEQIARAERILGVKFNDEELQILRNETDDLRAGQTFASL